MFAEAPSFHARARGRDGRKPGSRRGRTRKEGSGEEKGNVRRPPARPDKQAKVRRPELRMSHGKDEGTRLLRLAGGGQRIGTEGCIFASIIQVLHGTFMSDLFNKQSLHLAFES